MIQRTLTRAEKEQMDQEKTDFQNRVMDYSQGIVGNYKEIIEQQNMLVNQKTPFLDSSHLYIPRDSPNNRTRNNGPIYRTAQNTILSGEGSASMHQTSPTNTNFSLK